MKKVLTILLSLMMVLTLGACSSSSDSSSEDSDTGDDTTAKYTVGIVQLVQHDALDAATEGFKDALTEKLGDSVEFDYQNASNDTATCSTIVNGFVTNGYDLIMANATPAVQAALAATTTIPVLGTSVTDYASAIGQELNEDGSTGINLSGTSDGVPALMYVNATMEVVPDAKKVSIVYCSAEANSKVQANNFVSVMNETYPDVECTVYTFADSNDMATVVQSAIDCDAMYIPTDNTAAANMTIVSNITEPAGIPVVCGEEGMCKAGGLVTVSISYYDIGYKCGEMAAEILADGADVSTMAIGYADNLTGEYNPDYAQAIGITMPESYTALDMSE